MAGRPEIHRVLDSGYLGILARLPAGDRDISRDEW